MRNVWLIFRREYLERVKTKSFLVFTILIPLLMGGMFIVPMLLAGRRGSGVSKVVVVAENESVAKAVEQQLNSEAKTVSADSRTGKDSGPTYAVTISTKLTEEEASRLRQEVSAGRVDGFLWITPDALNSRKIAYSTKDSTDFGNNFALQSAVQMALVKHELAGHGIAAEDAAKLLKPVSLDVKRIENGKESEGGGFALFATAYVMVLMIYMSVLVYGMSVMRSIIEEKSSRIMEVMLSSVTPKQMMAGKLLGVGSVGLTQIAIWMVVGSGLAAYRGLASGEMFTLHLPISTAIYFAVFFVLGYLLYGAMYAAVGAMVNSDQEAQQSQFLVMMPVIFALIMIMPVIQNPSSKMAVWLSMVPFFTPLLMFVRIVVQPPPFWQIGSSIVLVVATIYGVLWLSSRIYRVGILMYGKRPTLPELVKWIKYA